MTVLVRGVIATSCTLLSRAINARAHRSTPSVIENAATSAATPMMTPVVESVVRVGFVRRESAPTRADSRIAAVFTLNRRIGRLSTPERDDDQAACAVA